MVKSVGNIGFINRVYNYTNKIQSHVLNTVKTIVEQPKKKTFSYSDSTKIEIIKVQLEQALIDLHFHRITKYEFNNIKAKLSKEFEQIKKRVNG